MLPRVINLLKKKRIKTVLAIIKAADSKRLAFNHPKTLCLQLSKLCEHSVGGTSGALYALFFGSGSRAFESNFDDSSLRKAIAEGLHAITYYGHAKVGHRTLVDPLNTAAESASDSSWQDLIKVCIENKNFNFKKV